MATDTRLWLYGALQDTRAYLADLIKTAVVRAEADVDVLMPGFTHLQVGGPLLPAPMHTFSSAWCTPLACKGNSRKVQGSHAGPLHAGAG